VAPAVAVALAERLPSGFAHLGGLGRLAAAEKALQPAEESCGRLGGRTAPLGVGILVAPRALVELRARLARRLVPPEIAPFRPRLAAALVPAIGTE